MQATIPIGKIVLDPRLQMRAKMDFDVIDEYAEHLAELPRCKVFLCAEQHLLTDGWHTYHAHKKAGSDSVPCTVTEGSFEQAVIEAAGANHGHGIRRTNDDKRRAVAVVLSTPDFTDKSDRAIAEICHVGHPLVAQVRAESSTGRNSSSSEQPVLCDRCRRVGAVKDCQACKDLQDKPPKRTGKDGRKRGPRKPSSRKPKAKPDGKPEAQTTELHVKASGITDAVQAVADAMLEGCEGSDGVLRKTLESQAKKLEKVIADVELLLHPSEYGKPTKEQRNAMFDAVAEVTGSDPKVSGSHIGRVVKLLLSADPPYEPGEIFALPEAIKKRRLNFTLTVGALEKYIGWVRSKSDVGDGLFAGIKEFLAESES